MSVRKFSFKVKSTLYRSPNGRINDITVGKDLEVVEQGFVKFYYGRIPFLNLFIENDNNITWDPNHKYGYGSEDSLVEMSNIIIDSLNRLNSYKYLNTTQNLIESCSSWKEYFEMKLEALRYLNIRMELREDLLPDFNKFKSKRLSTDYLEV